jgi:hypothetical protein
VELFTAGSPVGFAFTPSVISGLKLMVERDCADERQCLPARAADLNAKTLEKQAVCPAFEASLPSRF